MNEFFRNAHWWITYEAAIWGLLNKKALDNEATLGIIELVPENEFVFASVTPEN